MLTADLVRVRRRAGKLTVTKLRPEQRARLSETAGAYAALAAEAVGHTRGELLEAWDEVPHDATDFKLVKGLRKLLLDRCEFAPPAEIDPAALRREVFTRAAAARAALPDDGHFDRDAVLGEAAAGFGLSAEQAAEALYSDLKEHHRLVSFDAIDGPGLLARYELAQEQAVLLRALRVTVELYCAEPEGYRQFFRKLKFRRLLYRLAALEDGGYRIDIDGPLSMFQSVTKYGLQLALLLPALREAGRYKLAADVRWSQKGEPVRFELEGKAGGGAAEPHVSDEVARLLDGIAALDGPWTAALAEDVLEVPGEGVCVPDVVLTHRESGQRAFVEIMGYWSRSAVWQRVELVQAGLDVPIVFALSERLRVSEEVLDGDLPGQLYVYKGVISPRRVIERIAQATRA